ncbi:MAG: glycyl-radical enzyme activating protein [Promethearchaeota archaeon]
MAEAKNGFIFEIQKMSTEDGPGIRTTVFFKQCPLKCIWCHNPESILKKQQLEWFEHKCIGCNTCIKTCELEALKFEEDGLHIDRELCTSCGKCAEECPSTALHMFGEWWTLDNLYHEVQKDKVYYEQSKGGVTVSGGEPTIQSDFLLDFLKKCKDNGISTALDTCGYASKNVYEKLLPFVDLVLLDIKEIDSNKHEEFTGVTNNLILENAIWMSKFLKENNKQLWIRTPLIPNFTATKENIEGIGKFIVEKLHNNPERWDLLAFNNLCASKYDRLDMDWVLDDTPLMTKQEVENLYDVALKTGVLQVKWSGLTKKED